MKRLLLFLLAATLLIAPPSFAHGGMIKTSIHDNAKLSEAPADFKVTFQHESAITSMMLMTGDKKPVALGFKPSKILGREFTVPLPKLAAGSYVLSWKSMAKDGHVMPGAVRFTVTNQ